MIRNATETDISSKRRLIQSVPGFWNAEWRPNALERALRAADRLAFVWEENGAMLGFSRAHDVGFLAYLSLLVVDESTRGKGIGKMLLQHTEQELSRRGCVTLISDV